MFNIKEDKIEDIIDWFEKHLGYKLMLWQKAYLKSYLLGNRVFLTGRTNGRSNFLKAWNEYLRQF